MFIFTPRLCHVILNKEVCTRCKNREFANRFEHAINWICHSLHEAKFRASGRSYAGLAGSSIPHAYRPTISESTRHAQQAFPPKPRFDLIQLTRDFA